MTFSPHGHHLDLVQQMMVSYDIGAKDCDPKYVHMLGLAGECGEVLELLKKSMRDGTALDKNDLALELGDLGWYQNVLANDYGLRMSRIVDGTLSKLADRRRRNVMAGRGDHR